MVYLDLNLRDWYAVAARIFEDCRVFLPVFGLQIEKAVQLYMVTRYYMDLFFVIYIQKAGSL